MADGKDGDMRLSELIEASGVPAATIKYYLREGLLHPGEAVTATRAEYDETHVRRLAVIRALIDLAGVPVARVRTILGLVDHPGADRYETVGTAVAALPPYPPDLPDDPAARAVADYPLARAAIARLGWTWDPRFPAVAQLERSLAAVAAAGIPLGDERLDGYAPGVRAIAETELALAPADPAAFVEYAVVGTALYEPVLLALRRLAHQDVAARLLAPDPADDDRPL